MFVPPRTAQEERIAMRMLLPPRLKCRDFGLIRIGFVGCELPHLCEALCTSFSSAQPAHPRTGEQGCHTGIFYDNETRLDEFQKMHRETKDMLTTRRSNLALTWPSNQLWEFDMLVLLLEDGQ